MQKQIKFVYALFIIVIIGVGITMGILREVEKMNIPIGVNLKNMNTLKYAGTYKDDYGGKDDYGSSYGGTLIVYPKDDEKISFYLDVYSRNVGSLYGEVFIDDNGTGIFSRKNEDGFCKLLFKFTMNGVEIKEGVPDSYCEIGGYGVVASGDYKKIDKIIHDYFIDMQGNVYYFKNYSPDIINKLFKNEDYADYIDNLIKIGALQENKKVFEHGEQGISLKVIYTNKENKIYKYVVDSGSDDSVLTYNFYYDKDGKLIFVFITGGAINNSVLKHKIYFNDKGEKISESNDVTGEGWSWPELWPDDDIIFDPLKDYNN